jgi:hypothetical protein
MHHAPAMIEGYPRSRQHLKWHVSGSFTLSTLNGGRTGINVRSPYGGKNPKLGKKTKCRHLATHQPPSSAFSHPECLFPRP